MKNKSTHGRKSTQRENMEMTYADIFSELKRRFMEADVSDIQEHLAY